MELCIVAYFEVFRTKYEAKCSNSCVKCKSKFISRPVTIQDVILCLDIYPLIIHEANRGTSKNSNAAEERNRKARAFAVVARSSSKVICAYRVFMCNSSLKEKNWKDPNYSWARLIRNIRRTFSFVACCFASSVLHRDRPYYNRMIFDLMQLCG